MEKIVEEASKTILLKSGDKLLENTEALAAQRVDRQSGVYHSSFRLVRSPLKVQVVNDAPYAEIIEKGSAPHPIDPVNGNFLRIEPPIYINGRRVTALRHVEHPGTQPKWVLRDALRQTVRELF